MGLQIVPDYFWMCVWVWVQMACSAENTGTFEKEFPLYKNALVLSE